MPGGKSGYYGPKGMAQKALDILKKRKIGYTRTTVAPADATRSKSKKPFMAEDYNQEFWRRRAKGAR